MNTQDMLCVMLTLNKKHLVQFFHQCSALGQSHHKNASLEKGLYDQELEKATYIL